MVRTLIIEDEIDAQSLLSKIINEYCPSLCLIGIVGSVDEGITLIENLKPDLVFLDIEIRGGTSFQILDKLNDISFKIIFTTAYDQHALKAFKYEAIDYILKPYSPKDVVESVQRVNKSQFDKSIINGLEYLIKQSLSSERNKISISTTEGIIVLSINDIVRLEADKSYCYLYSKKGDRLVISKPLKDLESQLPASMFFRVHTTHLINIDFVKKYIKEDGGQIELNDNTRVPLARRRKQEFLAMLQRPRI